MNSSETKTTSNHDHDESPAAWIAVDWADNKHDVALLTTGSTQTEYAQIDHQPEALVHWVGQLRERFGGAPVGLIVEQKRGAFIHALLGHEFFRLYPVNPAMLANLRKAFHLSGAKDDPLDRDLLLEIFSSIAIACIGGLRTMKPLACSDCWSRSGATPSTPEPNSWKRCWRPSKVTVRRCLIWWGAS